MVPILSIAAVAVVAGCSSSEAFVLSTRAKLVLPSTIHLTSSPGNPEPVNNPIDREHLALDPKVASDFTIQVCTSTNCSKRLQQLGLDEYHVLGELYARAEARSVEECMIIEDGKCLGGKNCKSGPCVAILHDDFDGPVALEGMASNEFRERV